MNTIDRIDNQQYEMQPREPEIDFMRYVYALLRHRWIVVACVLFAAAISAIQLNSKQDRYTTVANILIENQGITVGSNNPYYRMPNTIDPDMIQQMMFSTPVMTKISSMLPSVSPDINVSFPLLKRNESPSSQLMVSIMASASDPKDAFMMADSMIKAFRSQLLDNQLQQTRDSMTWMVERLADQKKKIEEAEARFQEYKQSIMVVSFEDQKMAESRSIMEATSEMSRVTNEQLQLEVELKKLKESMAKGESYTDLTFQSQNVPSILTMLSEMNTLKVKLADNMKVFKEMHPVITDLNQQIASLRTRIETEKANTITALEIRNQTLLDRAKILQNSIDEKKELSQSISQKELQYRILEREVKTNSELYNSLLSELEGTDLRGKIESTTITVMDPPFVPMAPNPKGALRSLLRAIAVGMFIGIGIVFAIDFFESTLRSPEDVERKLGLPVVGMIPEKM